MNYRIITGVTALALMGGCATAQETVEVPGWLGKDFGEFVKTFEGQWDNDRHVFFAEDADMDVSEIAPRQHMVISRVGDADADGAYTFEAVRSFADEEPLSLFHKVSIDAGDQSIRQEMMTTADGSGADLNCQIDWAREGAQFRGKASGEGCLNVFSRVEDEGDLDVTLTLSERDFWVTSERGASRSEARFRRARTFECWTGVLRGASHGDSGAGGTDWWDQSGVKVHDQGGEAILMTDETPPREIRLKMRDVDWPYGRARASLVLYVHEGDNDRAVSYAWTEESADRIAINLRWIQVSCTHQPAEDFARKQ